MPDVTSATSLIEAITRLGAMGCMVTALYLLFVGKWMTTRHHEEIVTLHRERHTEMLDLLHQSVEENDQLRRVMISTHGMMRTTVDVATTAAAIIAPIRTAG